MGILNFPSQPARHHAVMQALVTQLLVAQAAFGAFAARTPLVRSRMGDEVHRTRNDGLMYHHDLEADVLSRFGAPEGRVGALLKEVAKYDGQISKKLSPPGLKISQTGDKKDTLLQKIKQVITAVQSDILGAKETIREAESDIKDDSDRITREKDKLEAEYCKYEAENANACREQNLKYQEFVKRYNKAAEKGIASIKKYNFELDLLAKIECYTERIINGGPEEECQGLPGSGEEYTKKNAPENKQCPADKPDQNNRCAKPFALKFLEGIEQRPDNAQKIVKLIEQPPDLPDKVLSA